MSKVNVHDFKGDLDKFEKEFTAWCDRLLHQEEEVPAEHPEIDFIEGKHEGTYLRQIYTGFAAIVQNDYMVHMIECENPLMSKFINALYAKSQEKGSYYRGIWVMHYAEDVAFRAYQNWTCKRITD